MKTQFVITDADPIFLVALMETMAAMQAEKDQGDEMESFVARFPDFESPDLEWIRAKAAEVLATRNDIPQSQSYSNSTATHSETVLPVFRYFRNPEGDEWKMPTNGEKGYVKQREHTEWDVSCSKLANFADDAGPIRQYMEFFPSAWILPIPKDRYDLIPPVEDGQGFFQHLPGIYCRNCGCDFALYSYSADAPHGYDENRKPFYNTCFKCSTMFAGSRNESPETDAFGHPVTSLDEPEASPTLQADASHDQASS